MTTGSACAFVLAAGANWETELLRGLGEAGVVVVKRCVDVPDLMASATSGVADVAVVAGDLPDLDADAVLHLLRYDVRTVALTDDPLAADRLARIGVAETTLAATDSAVAAVQRVAADEAATDRLHSDPRERADARASATADRGRVIAVWGPAGAPGRTTVACGLAADMAMAGRSTVLVDADPYGGTVAQQLGVLDEISGLLAVARLANTGALDDLAFARACRGVGDRFDVLTGLPRPERRIEVRPGVIGTVLAVATGRGDVVVDCGFCLEDAELPQSRDRMTLDALEAADEVVVVGSAEPSGLARLARGLVELREVVAGTPVRVVVNRMRPALGWSEREIVGMVEGYARPLGVHFLPEDRVVVDRALVSGHALAELGESALRTALGQVAAAVQGPSTVGASTPVRRRRGRRRANA